MKKTTVYLPDELKDALEMEARSQGCSEADLIRKAVSSLIDSVAAPKPKIPLCSSGDPTLADRVDEALEGFGLK